MMTTTTLMRAKIGVATSAVVLSALSPGTHPSPPTPLTTASSPRTVSMAVELAASITSDGSSQTVGVADAYLYTLNQTDLVNQLTNIRSLGVTDLRIVVPWIYIQPTSAATYDWSKMDNVINTARSMGFSMTASITMNPAWNGTPLVGAPNPDTYATFAAAVAQRYGNQIQAFEIWNEPNAVTFLAPTSPTAYTAMLKAAYTAIKAVDPNATVIAGVLGAVTTVPGMSLAPQQFLAGMYAAGAQGFFDALSFHPYNYTLPFSAGAGVTNSPLEQVKALYALMAANGDGALKVWATEFGNPTSPGGISQLQQAQMLRDFVTAWSKLPFAGPAFVYTANDLNSGYLLDENNFGLFTTSGIPKLAAHTLATLITQLAKGTLPNYTAPGISAPQTIWIQAVSTAIAVVNQVLLIPNVITGALYNAAPPALQQAFSAVARAVSMTAAQTLNAITPAAETGIGLLVNFPTSVHDAATALGASVLGTELTVQRALAAIGIGTVAKPAASTPTALPATAVIAAAAASAQVSADATTPAPASTSNPAPSFASRSTTGLSATTASAGAVPAATSTAAPTAGAATATTASAPSAAAPAALAAMTAPAAGVADKPASTTAASATSSATSKTTKTTTGPAPAKSSASLTVPTSSKPARVTPGTSSARRSPQSPGKAAAGEPAAAAKDATGHASDKAGGEVAAHGGAGGARASSEGAAR